MHQKLGQETLCLGAIWLLTLCKLLLLSPNASGATTLNNDCHNWESELRCSQRYLIYPGPFQGRAICIRLPALIYEDCGWQPYLGGNQAIPAK